MTFIDEVVEERDTWEFQNGTRLLEPTKARPYYRIIYRDRGGARHQPSGGKDFDLAYAKAADIDEKLGLSVGAQTDLPISALADAWLAAMSPEWATLHLDKYENFTDKYIRPQIGAIPAYTLTRDDVRQLLASPTSVSGKRHLRNAVGSMLVWGHDEEWLPQPREWYMPKKPRTAKREGGRRHGETAQFIEPALIPDAEHMRLLAEAMRDVASRIGRKDNRERFATGAWLMTAVAASCGPREGELWAMEARDFQLNVGDLHIERQVIRPRGGGYRVTLPKWGRVRDTIIPESTIWGEPLRPVLAEYLDGLAPDALVFPAAEGGYFLPSNFGRDLSKPAREAVQGWSAKWAWHSARHTFCTWLLSSDGAKGKVAADPQDVCDVAGHKDVSTTLRMYVGGTRGARDRLRAIAG